MRIRACKILGAAAGTPVFVIKDVLGVPNPFWFTNWPDAF
jgi:hypothetical protein